MNERGPHAPTMANSIGRGSNPLNGKVGSSVVTDFRAPGVVGYRFPSPAPTGYDPRRIVVVPNDNGRNPFGHDFVVTLRFRPGQAEANMVQKGQASAAGGYWKVETNGATTCTFKGSAGMRGIGTNQLRLTDNHWHTVRCERNGNTVTMTVDGKTVDVRTGPTGIIANTEPLLVGGKLRCSKTGALSVVTTSPARWTGCRSTRSEPLVRGPGRPRAPRVGAAAAPAA